MVFPVNPIIRHPPIIDPSIITYCTYGTVLYVRSYVQFQRDVFLVRVVLIDVLAMRACHASVRTSMACVTTTTVEELVALVFWFFFSAHFSLFFRRRADHEARIGCVMPPGL